MGTMTAQIMVGDKHPNDGGIRPEWMVQVSENSRPHIILHNNINYLAKATKRPSYFEWTPSLENGVEDILSMVALHVIKYEPLVEKINEISPEVLSKRVQVYDIPEDVRAMLYEEIRGVKEWPKLSVSIFFKCYLEGRFDILEEFPLDFEICKPVRVRERGGWGDINIKRDVGEIVRINAVGVNESK